MTSSEPAPRVRLRRLAAEEIRALPRGRFALAGAAALLALLAAFAAGPAVGVVGGLWGFGFFAYVVVPSALAAVVAARVAGARASLFVHGVFTMPVTKAQHLAASVLTSLALGGAYLLATLPYAAVAAHHLDGPGGLLRFFGVGVAMVAYATALGTLLGVLFTGRGVAAAVALAAAVVVVDAAALAYVASLLADGAGADAGALAVRLSHLSPVVLLVGAAGLLPIGAVPASPAAALAAFAVHAFGLLALAAWVYLREQGVEAWESTPSRRALVALALAAVVLAPAAVAGAEYEPGGERLSGAVSTSMSNMLATLAPRGADAQTAPLGGGRDVAPKLAVGEATPRDLLVILQSARHARVSDVHLTVESSPGLTLGGRTEYHFDALPRTETRRFEGHDGPPPAPPYSLPVLRIPLVLTPTDPHSLADNLYEVRVNVTFTVTPTEDAPPGSTSGPRRASALLPMLADVPHASAHMALAGAPFLLACVVGAATRRLRTR